MNLPDVSEKKIVYILIAAAVAALVVGFVVSQVRQARAIRQAESAAISRIDYNFGGGKAEALLVPNSTISKITATNNSCGTATGKEIDTGNYKVIVVHNLGLGIRKVYEYDVNDLTFTPGQDKLWNGQLKTVRLDLTGALSDAVAVYQYQDCQHVNARLLSVNQNTNTLEPFLFKSLNNQAGAQIVTMQKYLFKSAGKDKMDTVIANPDPSKPYAVVHWQFDPKDNLFKEVGKDAVNQVK